MAPNKVKGEWQGGDARDFREFQKAIRDVLKEQPRDSTWVVEIEVKKVGNPIHDYRIVLSPGG